MAVSKEQKALYNDKVRPYKDALEELKNLEEWPVRSRACREVGEADFSLKAFRVRLLAWFAKVGL